MMRDIYLIGVISKVYFKAEFPTFDPPSAGHLGGLSFTNINI